MRNIFFILLCCFFISCESTNDSNDLKDVKTLVTFVELGSVKCEPCLQMRPVISSLKQRYGLKLDTIIIDLFKEPKYYKIYNVYAMPTQVFLDSNGNEFHRHVGFYPENEIDSVLKLYDIFPEVN